MSAIHYLAAGDTGPSLSRQALLGTTPMALAGTPTFTLWDVRDMATPVLNALTAVLVDAPTGQLRFDWPSPNTLPPGKYLGRFRASDASGRTVSIPNEGHILILISS